MEQHIYTVTELTRQIKEVLEGEFEKVWVEGEISNLTKASSGHMYFSIKDENSLLGCVMFRGNSARMKFSVEDGMHVLCYGNVSLYEKRGQYQLYVSKIELRGKGALQMAFEQLKKKLFEEGLFDEEHKKALPFLPLRVGVVTSPTGAAIKDILKVSRRRFANIEISLRPVRVQGDEAKDDIVRALEELNEFNDHLKKTGQDQHPINVIILGRGGGSLEDLWAFNEEKVARAIHASKIPVISAVGHEIDYTISDFTADFRAATPSAAAELVMPLKEDLIARVDDCLKRLSLAAKTKIDILGKEVKSLKDSYVLRAPMNVFLQLEQQIDDLVRTAQSGMEHSLQKLAGGLDASCGKLEALNPLAVLERGYSIVFKEGKVVTEAARLKTGDTLETRFAKGKAKSRVESIEKKTGGNHG
ncbi:MAG: exodeoxyribonuclease VII large subunit [Candidatus Omnitrophica bacterium]|nr:exodeoxyribonuclease VII large subunit [Candidatus Omnitrophota bacterium]